MIHELAAAISLWSPRPQLPGSVPYARKYAIAISGTPGSVVRLRALNIPPNWVASFCTARVCAPFAVTIRIPVGGHDLTEFQLIPPDTQVDLSPRVAVSLVSGGNRFLLDRVSRPADTHR
ncbi:MAG: hypothetical protein M3N19_09995 [Candidatus Eremiobacteraeota bacterium]|nr:hypothetical protein [Candidatus Eremiobacteraeota bacterium]